MVPPKSAETKPIQDCVLESSCTLFIRIVERVPTIDLVMNLFELPDLVLAYPALPENNRGTRGRVTVFG